MADVRTRAIMQPMIARAKPKGSCGTKMPASPFSTRMPAIIEPSRRAAGNRAHVSKAANRIERAIRTPQRANTGNVAKDMDGTLSAMRKREISTFDDPADPWKDVADSKVVHLRGHGARGIFGKNDGIAVFPCLSCRRLDADVRCDASQNDCLDTAAAQLQIQLRAMEGAPLALGDENVARLRQSIDQLAEIFGKAARRCGEGLIDRLPQGVFEILGEAYIHEHDGRPCFAEGVRERAAGLRDPVCRVRLQFVAHDALLQINEDQSRRLGIECKHAFSPVGLTFGGSPR